MIRLEKVRLRDLIDNADKYPEISIIILPKNQKTYHHMLNKTLDHLIRYSRRYEFNVSITIKNNNTSAKNIFANVSEKIIIGK